MVSLGHPPPASGLSDGGADVRSLVVSRLPGRGTDRMQVAGVDQLTARRTQLCWVVKCEDYESVAFATLEEARAQLDNWDEYGACDLEHHFSQIWAIPGSLRVIRPRAAIA